MKYRITTLRGFFAIGLAALISIVLIDQASFSFNSLFEIYSHADLAQIVPLSCVTDCNGLVGYWPFDEGSGTTANDLSGNGNNGTLLNFPTDGSGWVTGKLGKAVHFDDQNTKVVTTSDPIGANPGTFSAWIYPISQGASNAGRIIDDGETAIYLSSSNRFTLSSDDTNTSISTLINTIPYNTWTFITATRDSTGKANLYVNGVLSNDPNRNSGIPTAGTNLIIGNNAPTNATFDGYLDDVRIYNRILGSDEIYQLYLSENSGIFPTTPATFGPLIPTSPPIITPPPVVPPVLATTYYIRSGATGLSNGTDWTNAFTIFPTLLIRGDTYYLAGGSYPTITLSSPVLGTTSISIKKATATDHGPAAIWDDSYGNNPAVINGTLNINSPYINIDGITGSENSGYGIKVIDQTCSSLGAPGIVLDQNMGNIHVSHIEVQMCGAVPFAQDAVYAVNTIPTSGQHFSYLYLHDVARNGFSLYNQSGDTIIEHSRLEKIAGNITTPDIHGQAIQLTDAPMNDITIRFNKFIDIDGTAAVALLGSSGHTYSNIYIYGNIFWSSDMTKYTYSPAAIYGREGSNTQSNILVYNNTFYNVYNPNTWMNGSIVTNSQNKNNLYVNSYFQFPNGLAGSTTNPDSTNNYYYNNTGSYLFAPMANEIARVNGSASPFVNAPYDLHLVPTSEAIGSGTQLAPTYAVDYDGNPRPTGSGWDIGAYEYCPQSTCEAVSPIYTPPVPPVIPPITVSPVIPPTVVQPVVPPYFPIGNSGGGGGGGIGESAIIIPLPIIYSASTTTVISTTTPYAKIGHSAGLTIDQIKAIIDLLLSFNTDQNIVTSIKTELSDKSANTSSSYIPSISFPTLSSLPAFTRSLTVGSSGVDVKDLQIFLNAQGFNVSVSGAGSPGHEIEHFGNATRDALTKYQDENVSTILTPNGLTHGTGYFGPATMKKVNQTIGN